MVKRAVHIDEHIPCQACTPSGGEIKEKLDFSSFSGGGLYWTRTSDPIDVNDVLYQLSQQTTFLGLKNLPLRTPGLVGSSNRKPTVHDAGSL